MSTPKNVPSIKAKPTTEDIKVFRKVFYADCPDMTDEEIVRDLEKCFDFSAKMIAEAEQATGCIFS